MQPRRGVLARKALRIARMLRQPLNAACNNQSSLFDVARRKELPVDRHLSIRTPRPQCRRGQEGIRRAQCHRMQPFLVQVPNHAFEFRLPVNSKRA